MTAHTRSSILAASLLIFCLSGCTPTVNSVTVTPGTDVNLVNVQASISSAGGFNGDSRVARRFAGGHSSGVSRRRRGLHSG